MPSNRNGVVYGITGGSGVGKSYVTGLFKPYNAYIIDADKIGHEVLSQEMDAIKRAFGADIVDENNNVNRKKLGGIVFSDPSELKRLNAIVHPKIVEKIYRAVAMRIAEYDVVIIDAALLFDLQINHVCDQTILVTANEDTKIERIVARDGITPEAALARIQSQRNDEDLKKLADIVIENDNNFNRDVNEKIY